MSESDRISELAAQAKNHDKEAFENLYSIYVHRVYYFLYQLLEEEESAIDATKNTFVFAWQHISFFPQDQSFYHWICGIAYQMFTNKMDSSRGITVAIDSGDGTDTFYDDIVAKTIPSEKPTVKKSDLEYVNRQLLLMTLSERICILLHDLCGYSVEDISAVTNCTEDSVKSHVYNAKMSLRSALEGKESGSGYRLIPFLPLLFKTCSKEFNVPEETAIQIREALSGDEEGMAIPQNLPEMEVDDSEFPVKNKWIWIVCIILGIAIIGLAVFLIWRLNPNNSLPDESDFESSVFSEDESIDESTTFIESSEETSDTSDDSVSDETSTESSVISESSDNPVSDETSDSSVPEESSQEETTDLESSAESSESTGKTTDNLRLRANANTSSTVLALIPSGSTITILDSVTGGDGNVWYHAKWENEGTIYEGYCSSLYVTRN